MTLSNIIKDYQNQLLGFCCLFLLSCQSSPINEKDDVNLLAEQSLINLIRLSPSQFTKPEVNEQNLIRAAIIELYSEKDQRFFPLIKLLKENRLSLLISDINKEVALDKNQKDFEYLGKLRYYKLAIQDSFDPLQTQKDFIIFNQNEKIPKSKNWQLLEQELNKRLSISENQITILQLQLLNAEIAGKVGEQTILHNQIFEHYQKINAHDKMIYHLNKIIELNPVNDINKLNVYEKLINLYRQTGQSAQMNLHIAKALELAKTLNQKDIINNYEENLGIINTDPEIEEYSSTVFEVLSEMEQDLQKNPKQQTPDNLLIIAAKYLEMGNLESSANVAIRALNKSRTDNNSYTEALSINLIGDVARINADFNRARIQYSLASEIFKNLKKLDEQLMTLVKLLRVAIYQEDWVLAKKTLEDIHLFNDTNGAKMSPESLVADRVTAETYIYNSAVQKSFQENNPQWINAIKNLEKSTESVFAEELFAHTAIILNINRQPKIALDYFEKAVFIAFEQNRYFEAGRYLTNIGIIYKAQNQIEHSRKSLRQAASIFKSINSPLLTTVEKIITTLK